MIIENGDIDLIKEQLSVKGINLVWTAEESGLDIDELITYCNTHSIQLAGGIFPGIISQYGYSKTHTIVKNLNSSAKPCITRNLNTENFEVSFPAQEGFNSAIVIVDGLTANISKYLEKIYEKYWNNISYTGGGAGSLSLESQPCVFTNEGFFQDCGLIIPLDDKINVGIKHGWEKIAGPFIVNKVEATIIKELNWRPAFEVYKEVLAENGERRELNEQNFFEISKGFPFGVARVGLEDVVRDPIITNEKKELICVGEIAKNTSINLLRGNTDSLVESARLATQIAVKDKSFNSVLVIDCISRVLFMEDDFVRELDSIRETIHETNPNVDLEGALTLGEISAYRDGLLEFFNKTIVVSTILDS